MIEELQSQLIEYIEKAIEIRFDFPNVDYSADFGELHIATIKVQSSLTELERLLSNAIRAKAVAERRVAKYKMIWQEAWDKAISATNKRPTLGEYATGKEKASEANLATFQEARVLRSEEELLSFANEAVDVIRLHYYGLDKVRQDLRKRLDLSQSDYFNS